MDTRRRLGGFFGLAILLTLAGVFSPDSSAAEGDARPQSVEEGPARPTVDKATAGLDPRRGFFDFHYDAAAGKIWLEIPPPVGARGEAARFIYTAALTTGLGSNPVGLDRGQIRDAKLLVIRRLGPRVFFEQPNLRFRALSADPAEQLATAESFATSILWAQEIAAIDPDGRSLVDLTPFLTRDAQAVVRKLQESEQGSFSLDPDRSLVDPAGCLAFPDNVELEAILTFASEEPGDHVRSTVPTPQSITLVAHHSLVRLPDDDYRPRRFDPRAGLHAISFSDYASELDESIRRQWIQRHRLRKVDPAAPRSRAVEPLVYYVDPGAPEPVRSALIEGAGWWAEAFEAAGLVDAFRVELLPEGVHPLDVRYNVIQWVHRSTRGWSYGGGVVDPRTGEILKGHVNLGSLRVRQDRRIFEGLAGVGKTGSGAADDPVEIALARIRQLSAHEVGHTLGLGHNFAASTYGRASVMDYPAPWVTVDSAGELDFSRAYATGIGAWDRHAIRYAYSELALDEERSGLEQILQEGLDAGLVFLSDDDARPAGAAEPRANLWDNGADPVAALEETLAVREIALARFGEHNVAAGTALAELQEVLATVYFYHRYQLEAAVKVIGGMEYAHAMRGDGQPAAETLPAERQRQALETILKILTPAQLDLPEAVLRLLAPRPFESSRNREMFASATEPAFDALGAASTAAGQVAAVLLQPERLGRLIDFHRRDPTLPPVEEVLTALIDKAFEAPTSRESSRHSELRHVVRRTVVEHLLQLAVHPAVGSAVRAHAEAALRQARRRLPAAASEATEASPYALALAGELDRFSSRTESLPRVVQPPAPLPPGSPIGDPGWADCGVW